MDHMGWAEVPSQRPLSLHGKIEMNSGVKTIESERTGKVLWRSIFLQLVGPYKIDYWIRVDRVWE